MGSGTLRRAVVASAILAVAFASAARATEIDCDYCFFNITDNSGEAADVAQQLELCVYDMGDTPDGKRIIAFEFYNNGPIDSVITDIYWDDRGGPIASLFDIATDWASPANPPNLPSATALDPDFAATYSVDSDPPPAQTGIHDGESAIFTLLLTDPNDDLDDVKAALDDGTLRVGIHVQSIGESGNSDTFVAYPCDDIPPPEIPEPGTMTLLGLGLAGLGVAVRRRRRRRL